MCFKKVLSKPKARVMSENVYGTGELLDSLSDALDIAEGLGESLKDGFQVWDLAKLLEVYPKAQEIFNDRNQIKKEFLDLTADETEKLYADLAQIRGVANSWVEKKALAAIDFAAEAYETFEKLKTLLGKAKVIIS